MNSMVADNTSADTSNPSFDEIDIDKRVKQQLVIDTIMKHVASSSSSHKILLQINDAIANGSHLSCKILSGGYTNYSYQVTVKDHPDLCLFAKLSFEYALWNPDKSIHYSLKRTDNEWVIMEAISKLAPDCVVKPLGCLDVHQDGHRMKLLVTEWSNADEQFCNQFIDGAVDPRIAPRLAETLAKLHNIKDFDPDFNVNVKPCMENLMEQMRVFVREACAKKYPKNRTETYCVEVGSDTLGKVVDGIISSYHDRDCLIHSDSHVFNILVEPKPSVEELESFGPNGSMVLCDWEMTMAGPMGRDVGLAMSFPIACYISHAFNGCLVESIHEFITILVQCYLNKMEQAGMGRKEQASLYRNIIGWSGRGFHLHGVQDNIPLKNEEAKAYVQDAMGLLGLKMMRFAMDKCQIYDLLTLDQLKSIFEEMLQEEVSRAYSCFANGKRRSKHMTKPRKSSFLRAANRGIHDARMNIPPVKACLEGLDLADDEYGEEVIGSY